MIRRLLQKWLRRIQDIPLWLRRELLLMVVGMVIISTCLFFLNEWVWGNYFATVSTPQYTYQWYADREVCDGRPGQLGWSTSYSDGTILWCTDNGAVTKDGQPGKFSWWIDDWKLYRQRRFLGWWPNHWLEKPRWWDLWFGWIPCIFSGPTNCT